MRFPEFPLPLNDVDALFRELSSGPRQTEVMDITSWTREFHVRDPDGNGLQFYRHR
jgi:hypothetical protein